MANSELHVIFDGKNIKTDVKGIANKIIESVKKTPEGLTRELNEEAWKVTTGTLNKVGKGRRYGKPISWSGKLADSVKTLNYKGGKLSKLYIPASQQAKAVMNEFGQKPAYKPFATNPNLLAWARDRAPQFLGKGGVPVGYGETSNVQFGKSRNKFWINTFYTMNKRVGGIMDENMRKKLSNMKF